MITLAESQDFKTIKTDTCKMVYRQGFDFYKNHFLSILQWFPENKNAIHDDRNILKIIDLGGCQAVVKSFKTPNVLSRWIYTFFRASKARRSLENSLILKERGFNVPEPIAYMEFFNNRLIKESFYISKKIIFDCTLHEVARGQKFTWLEILPFVVEHAYSMHQAGIIHRDFSHGNILVTQTGADFNFSLVDLNRLFIGKVSFNKGLKSLVRLIDGDISLQLVASKYAECGRKDAVAAKAVLQKHYTRHLKKKTIKRNLKSFLGIKKK